MKWLIYGATGLVLVFAIGLFFQVNTISVEGNERYTSEDIVRVSELVPGGSMFIFDKSGAERKVKEHFPYIEDAVVKLRIPDMLTISVTESVPLARVSVGNGAYALLDRRGKILEVGEDIIAGVELRGVPAIECRAGAFYELDNDVDIEALDYALEILNELALYELIEKTAFLEASALNPVFRYDRIYSVELGARYNTAAKIRLFELCIPQFERGVRATVILSIPGQVNYVPMY